MRLVTALSIAVLLMTSPSANAEGEVSISTHWKRPVHITGEDTPAYLPTNCAGCHPGKVAEWRSSLHSVTVGPGLLAQLSPSTNASFAQSCYYCHAPAAEQQEFLTDAEGKFKKNPAFDSELRAAGVSCAVCHMREGTIYGPPGALVVKGDKGHRSVEADIFGSAEFCAECHQLDAGYKLNGKMLVNTYKEWKESTYGELNITCQTCHMPDKKHLFRGIHDREMTRGALKIETDEPVVEGGTIKSEINITNTGAGHYFPTYITPLVIVSGSLIGADGKVIAGTERESYIGRMVTQDLSREIYDTRIAPEKTLLIEYEAPLAEGAEKLRIEIHVSPDEFYHTFFKNRVVSGYAIHDKTELYKALKATAASPYLLYREELPIK